MGWKASGKTKLMKKMKKTRAKIDARNDYIRAHRQQLMPRGQKYKELRKRNLKKLNKKFKIKDTFLGM